MKRVETVYEHRGVKFVCTDELLEETDAFGIDLMTIVPASIDAMLDAMNQDTADFKVRLLIRKDRTDSNVVSYDLRVVRA